MKKLIITISLILFYFYSNAQSVAINNDGSIANSSSILDIKSTTKGILIPRMSKTEKNSITILSNGLLVYQNAPDSIGFHYYNGANWVWLQNTSGTASGWSTTGNASINSSNFIGTLSLAPILFKINNGDAGGIGRYGNVILGSERENNNFFNETFAGSSGNTAIGNRAMRNNTIMGENTIVGYAAAEFNRNGSQNVAMGHFALRNNKNGNYAVAIGKDALLNDTSAQETVAIGGNALYYNQARYGNTAVGSNSLFFNTHTTGAPISINEGLHNTALGHSALFNNKRGSGSVAIGYNAGYNSTTSNKLYIENSSADSLNALIFGDFAADSLNLNAKVNIRDFTRLGTQTDEAPAIKMKKLIIPFGPAVDAFQSYPMGSGITDAKVIGVQIFVTYASPWKIPASYRDAAGFEFNYQVQANNIVIINKAGNSANIGAKPFTVLITYEE